MLICLIPSEINSTTNQQDGCHLILMGTIGHRNLELFWLALFYLDSLMKHDVIIALNVCIKK